MGLRGLLVIVTALLFASAGGAESPVQPAPQRLGRPVLQPPGAEERQIGTPGGGQEPGGTQQPGSTRLGRPVLAVPPPPGVRGAPRQEAPAVPPHPTASPNGSASSEGPPR